MPVTMSLGAPSGFQVFPHVKFSGHRFTFEFPGKSERKRISDRAFRQPALQLNSVAIDYAGKITRDEFAAMNPLNAAPLLM